MSSTTKIIFYALIGVLFIKMEPVGEKLDLLKNEIVIEYRIIKTGSYISGIQKLENNCYKLQKSLMDITGDIDVSTKNDLDGICQVIVHDSICEYLMSKCAYLDNSQGDIVFLQAIIADIIYMLNSEEQEYIGIQQYLIKVKDSLYSEGYRINGYDC